LAFASSAIAAAAARVLIGVLSRNGAIEIVDLGSVGVLAYGWDLQTKRR
jgi:hypothetical protein